MNRRKLAGRFGVAAYYSIFKPAYIKALADVPLKETGITDDGIPYAICSDNTRLFGQLPTCNERRLYRALHKRINPAIHEDTFRVAIDIIRRYQYPNALAGLTMPYSYKERLLFGTHTSDTIADCPSLSTLERERLSEKFTPQYGEPYVDIGAYMGYGTLGIRKLVGDEAPIIAVEARAENVEILRRNVEANSATNVKVVHRAVWSERTTIDLLVGHRQANTVLSDVIKPTQDKEEVNADTIANILQEYQLREVSLVSMTINGAEVEAIRSLKPILASSKNARVTAPGWFFRKGQQICELIVPLLQESGLKTLVLPRGRVLAWKE